MAVTQNPASVIRIGFNGATKTGFLLESYDHTKEGDLERISSDGSIITYLVSNNRDAVSISVMMASATGSLQPPAIGSTFTLTVPATTGEIDEDSASAASLEWIVTAAKCSRVAGAAKLDVSLERPTAMNFN